MLLAEFLNHLRDGINSTQREKNEFQAEINSSFTQKDEGKATVCDIKTMYSFSPRHVTPIVKADEKCVRGY